ncbi:MAG TPA: hypothetical protein ENI06_11780 [Spirochaetales bacterium]|nr:hypothetical protein [Spirochaetales bacterium]
MEVPVGRYEYSKRIGTVEPVFANTRDVLHLDRFTLRSKKKANIQWLLYYNNRKSCFLNKIFHKKISTSQSSFQLRSKIAIC